MDDNQAVEQVSSTRDVSLESSSSELLELLGGLGESVSAEPERLEEELGAMLPELRRVLGLGYVELRAEVRKGWRVLVSDGLPGNEAAVEVPIVRDGARLGHLYGSPANQWTDEQTRGLQAVAAFCGLSVDAARAREEAATRAARGSMVQIASEALGAILDEDRLYQTVLVLVLELMEASGVAVLTEDGDAVSRGEGGEALLALGPQERPGRKPWIGEAGGYYALGVSIGRSGGSLFVARTGSPYTGDDGASLKLVARQLARARERSRLHASLEKTTVEAISALAAALESRDGTTGAHIRRTQALAGEVAEAMGLSSEQVQDAQYTAILHDVGKIGIPDAVLNKPGGLDEREWELMRRHPKMGADIVSRIEGFQGISRAILAHHERLDGGGYPSGLSGEAIPVEARITSAIDTYDAMTSDRPYRKALSHEEALDELDACSGTQLDPEVVEALKSVLDERGDDSE